MLRDGSLRVGTLYEYRDSERYSDMILDTDKGKRRTKISFDRFEGTGNELNQTIGLFSGDGQVNIYGGSVQSHESSPDYYIYCTTSSFFSDTLKQAIADKKEACVMITDPEQFFTDLSIYIGDKKFIGIYPCVYGSRDFDISFDNDKDLTYFNQ